MSEEKLTSGCFDRTPDFSKFLRSHVSITIALESMGRNLGGFNNDSSESEFLNKIIVLEYVWNIDRISLKLIFD
jgi:hypothetical protein